MPDVAFSAPILPGKLDAWRTAMARCQPDNPEYVESRRRLGVTREECWLQSTPGGDVAVVFVSADDLGTAFQGFATSSEPFDVWFRDAIQDAHGIDLSAPTPPPEQGVDYRG